MWPAIIAAGAMLGSSLINANAAKKAGKARKKEYVPFTFKDRETGKTITMYKPVAYAGETSPGAGAGQNAIANLLQGGADLYQIGQYTNKYGLQSSTTTSTRVPGGDYSGGWT